MTAIDAGHDHTAGEGEHDGHPRGVHEVGHGEDHRVEPDEEAGREERPIAPEEERRVEELLAGDGDAGVEEQQDEKTLRPAPPEAPTSPWRSAAATKSTGTAAATQSDP